MNVLVDCLADTSNKLPYFQALAIFLEELRAFVVVGGTNPSKIFCKLSNNEFIVLIPDLEYGNGLTFTVPLEEACVVTP